jgi:hypothetical protein
MTEKLEPPPRYGDMRAEIVALLDTARTASVRSVNALMTATYWEIGAGSWSSSKRARSGRSTARP